MKKFSTEESLWIKNNYRNKTILDLSLYLGRTKASISGFLNKNGLRSGFDYSRPNSIGLEDEKLCYLLGFIWADGFVDKKGFVDLNILSSDGQKILPIVQYVEGFRSRLNNRKNKKQTISFICRNKDFASLLLSLKFNEKSFCEPNKLLSSMPRKNHYLFWRGFFDGDGCIYDQKTSNTKVSKRVEISGQYNYRWIELSKLLKSLNCSFCIRRIESSCGKRSLVKIWRKADVVSFGEYLYSDEGVHGCLMRKKLKFY